MFESAELAHAVPDAAFEKEEARLRADLLDAQYDILADASSSIIVLVNGVDGAGKGETVNVLNEWMDPRHIRSRAFGPRAELTSEERDHPAMWRFWRALPPKGRMGIFFGSWYTDPIIERIRGRCDDAALTTSIDRVRRFERMLIDEGAVIVKLWFHLSKKAQKKRFDKLESDKRTRWRVTKQDWKNHAQYEAFARLSERVLRETSSGDAPWVVVDGRDKNYRSLAAGRTLLAAMRARLDERKRATKRSATHRATPRPPADRRVGGVDTSDILRSLEFKERLSESKYEKRFDKAQARLAKLAHDRKMKDRSVILAFEGMDAAGKGGAIRRITRCLDARQYEVIPISAPNEEERAQPYLWRFWRHIPRRGRFVLYDRSWYGRVLVERVEGFASEDAWRRAYAEINDFEEQLTDDGYIVAKLWLAVSNEEQLRRFKQREKTRFKRFKITPEDWRNRAKWDDYVTAASDMIDRTSTSLAPWTVLEANDKRLARVRALETVCERIEASF